MRNILLFSLFIDILQTVGLIIVIFSVHDLFDELKKINIQLWENYLAILGDRIMKIKEKENDDRL